MKSRSMLLAAALAVALPALARAQDPSPKAADAAQTAIAEPGYGTLVSSLQASEQELAKLEALDGLARADVTVVDVDDILVEDQPVAFDQARTENEAGIVSLQEFLNTTDMRISGDGDTILTFGDVLGESGVGVGDVVAVSVSGGQVTLFVANDSDEETDMETATTD